MWAKSGGVWLRGKGLGPTGQKTQGLNFGQFVPIFGLLAKAGPVSNSPRGRQGDTGHLSSKSIHLNAGADGFQIAGGAVEECQPHPFSLHLIANQYQQLPVAHIIMLHKFTP